MYRPAQVAYTGHAHLAVSLEVSLGKDIAQFTQVYRCPHCMAGDAHLEM